MFYTRCLSCKTSLLSGKPFRLLDRICKDCLEVLSAKAHEEQFYMDELDRVNIAG